VEELESPHVSAMYEQLPKGKMLRAKLVKMIAGKHPQSDLVAAVIEMIHLSSLLHDDVIDEAATRRGEPSINALYSDKHAVMLGDIFYSKAFYELVSLDARIARSVSSAVTKLSLGELLDVELANGFNTDIDAYLKMIYLKTAALIETTTHCAAILDGANEAAYRTFGRNLGIAYQIVDDILDVTQDAATLGKPAFNDYVEGKTTLPFILMHDALDAKGRAKLKSLFKKPLSPDEEMWLRENLAATGAIAQSVARAKALADEAKEQVGKNPVLTALIDTMISRSF
jgi:octaprenyl-diphosphate synthase